VTSDDPGDALDAALKDAGRLYDSGQRLEARVRALHATLDFLKSMGFSPTQLRPLGDLSMHAMHEHLLDMHGKRPGPKPKSIPQQLLWASAAAAVTVLVSRGSNVTRATNTIAKAAGLDRKRLRNFRDNINRGCTHTVTTKMYDEKVEKWGASLSEQVMVDALKTLRPYC